MLKTGEDKNTEFVSCCVDIEGFVFEESAWNDVNVDVEDILFEEPAYGDVNCKALAVLTLCDDISWHWVL